jgi:hypothetical protein
LHAGRLLAVSAVGFVAAAVYLHFLPQPAVRQQRKARCLLLNA